MDLPPLGQDFEVWGQWWLPDREDAILAGAFRSRNGVLELQLIGRFESIDLNDRWQKVPLIHGAADAKAFTLWNSVQDMPSVKIPGTCEQRFIGMIGLVGSHFNLREKTEFSRICLKGRDLGAWSGKRGIDHEISFDSEISYRFGYSPDSTGQEIVAVEDLGIDVKIGADVQTVNKEFERYGFEITPAVDFKFGTPMRAKDAPAFIDKLVKFFTLFIGREFVPERVTGIVAGRDPRDGHAEFRFDHPVPELQNSLHSREALAPYGVLKESLSAIISSWFIEYEKISDPVGLLAGALRKRRLPIHIELTTLCQSLEAFHRNVFGGKHTTKKRMKEIANGLDACISEDVSREIRKAIIDRVRFAHEYSFRERLTGLIENLKSDTLSELNIEPSEFVKEVVGARNDFTHWDVSQYRGNWDGAELRNLISKLNALARVILLNYLGVDESLLVKRMKENRHLYLPEWLSLEDR